MNTKDNRRRQASREKIERVFVSLLQSYPLNEITVSDICKRAELNRSTFYANYDDVYALADAIREKLEQDVIHLYEEDVASQLNSNDYLRLFYHIRDNQLFYKTYFKLGYDRANTVFRYNTALANQLFHEKHIDYHIEFFKAGFNAIVQKWLAGGCAESPEELEEILKTEYQGRVIS